MVQLSRKPLPKHVQETILESLRWLVTSLNRRQDVDAFLQDFLSKTEKIMLAKRLAIALLLEKGYGPTEIRYALNVSTSTVIRIQQVLESGGRGYKLAIRKLAEKEELDRFWKGVREVLHMAGKGRKVFG